MLCFSVSKHYRFHNDYHGEERRENLLAQNIRQYQYT